MGKLYEFIAKNSQYKEAAKKICVSHWDNEKKETRKEFRMGYFIGKLDAFIDSGRELPENSYVKYGNGLIDRIYEVKFQMEVNDFLEKLREEGKLIVGGEFHRVKLYRTEKFIKSD